VTREHCKPVPFDVNATRARWMQRPGFAEAYEDLADEYAAVGELQRARKQAAAERKPIKRRPQV